MRRRGAFSLKGAMQDWYRDLFGPDYLRMDWHDTTLQEVDSLGRMVTLRRGTKVLDLCCGYGRHAIPLAAKGCRVTGLDLSEALLSKAQADAREQGAAVDWVRADARRLPLRGGFDVVLNLFTAFGYFEREGENLQVLQEAARVLAPGGHFVLDVVNHDFLVRYFEEQNWYDRGDSLVLEERSFDHQESRVYGSWTLVEADGTRRVYPNSIRAYTFAELRLLLTLVGLDVVQVYGGYDRQPLSWESPRMVILSRKGA